MSAVSHQSHTERTVCIHCGGLHPPGMRRCPSTGKTLGGDPRLIGQVIAKRYRVIRVLSDGFFGAEYKAQHVTIGRLVALKILRAELVRNPKMVQRFLREARLLGSVTHERLQPVLDAGVTADGSAYVAYQYARGRTLARAFARGATFTLERAATLTCEILDGLAAIHRSGFVHRMLMPDSVLLQLGASGVEHVLLTNFGAATFEVSDDWPDEEPSSLLAVLPRGPYVLPAYAREAKPDRREDILAAGVLLAAMLSPGGVPRFGSDLLALGVPASVEGIIAKAIHPAVDARYESAEQMREQLRPFASEILDEPVSVTETVVNDLRALRMREMALDTLPARLLLEVGNSTLSANMAGALVRAVHDECQARWDELRHRVPGIERYLILEGPDGYVPAAPVVAALEESDVLCGTGDRLYCVVVGERAGEQELAEYVSDIVGHSTTPEFLIDSLSTLWPSVVGQGVPKTSYVGRGYGRFEIRDQLEPSLAFCSAFSGILRVCLERVGASSVEVSKSACEAVGDPACVFSVTWNT